MSVATGRALHTLNLHECMMTVCEHSEACIHVTVAEDIQSCLQDLAERYHVQRVSWCGANVSITV